MFIEGKNLVKKYGKGEATVFALDHTEFGIEKGEIVVILGPSGSGKSTLLNILGGLDKVTEGSMLVDGTDLEKMSAKELELYRREKLGFVFQSYNLTPDLTVRENIEMTAELVQEPLRADTLIEELGLKKYETYFPKELSGGQQQRVAIARALVCEPRVLLLDEPLGALDLKLRKDMQIELKRIQQRTGITFIYVTHDQEEALTMSDRVVVMNHGVIQQVGSPTDIYNEPVNAFVADFIGESNIIDGVMLEDCKVEFCGRTFECVDKGFEKNAPVDVVIRPEDLKIVYAGDGLLQGVVESIVFKGVHYEMMVRTQFFTFMVHSTMAESVGKTVGLSVIPFDIHIMHKSAEAQA